MCIDNDCFLVVAAIPYNSGTQVKYFARGKEVYHQYYGYLIRISAQHVDWGTNPGPGTAEASEPAAASADTEPSTELAKRRSKSSRGPKKVYSVHLFFSVSVSLYLLNIHTGFVSARGWHWILIECQNTQGMIYSSLMRFWYDCLHA